MLRTCLLLSAVACLAIASPAKKIKLSLGKFEHDYCDSAANQPLVLNTLNVVPDPVEIHTGATIDIEDDVQGHVNLDLLEVVPEGSTVELKAKKLGLIDLPIPCVEVEGLHIGSCTYQLQDLLNEFADFLCPDWFPEGQSCTLPLNPGTYSGSTQFVLPEIPSLIIDLLASGTYQVTVHAIRPDGTEETCFYIKADITS